MEIRNEPELSNDDLEYQAGLIDNDNAINNIIQSPLLIYNLENFQSELIIKYFQSIGLIGKSKKCPKCGNIMNICKRTPVYDVKINTRKGTLFENFEIKIQIIYFLLYYCFIENTSLSTASEKIKNIYEQIGEIPPIINTISKFFMTLREKLRVHMHAEWEKNLLGIEINQNLGYPSVEIDESKIISSGNLIFWMFGVIDRNTKRSSCPLCFGQTDKGKFITFD